MKFTAAAISVAFLGSVVASTDVDSGILEAAINCNEELGDLEFVFLEDEAVVRSIEDDIRADLSKIGLNVVAKPLDKGNLNAARQSGDFHLSISETWGLPYDPHSFAAGWIDGAGGEGIYPAMENFEAPSTREELLDMVTEVLQLEDIQEVEAKWLDIHTYYHEQAVLMPLYGKRIPTLMNRRLVGYEAGHQQFDYPVHRLFVDAGPKNVTICPGARNGLFHTVGTMNAHVYGPNEFFSNNWVYEGLVAFGGNGLVQPALATEWSKAPNDLGGDTYTFKLRESVLFHDGALWDCSVAKLNFDHILARPLAEIKHSWYGVGSNTVDWFCDEDNNFVMRTNVKYEAYLKELSLIRPTRMISPNSFIGDDAFKNNSCHVEWGTVEGTDGSVTCVGIQSISGTGPFEYISEDTKDGTTNSVLFGSNKNYWGTVPDIDFLKIVRYASSDDVKDALLSDELDLVWGAGVLSDTDILDFRDDPEKSTKIQLGLSNPIQNAMLILNTGNPPLDNINVRKTVIHAINKGALVEKELPLSQQVDNIFPRDAPYCDVDLSPRWSYDFEKAAQLSCDGTAGNYTLASTNPTDMQNVNPTEKPSWYPTISPSYRLSVNPTETLSLHPILYPTLIPSLKPTKSVSFLPTILPTDIPTLSLTSLPTKSPTFLPNYYSSVEPTLNPSIYQLSINPTAYPTLETTSDIRISSSSDNLPTSSCAYNFQVSLTPTPFTLLITSLFTFCL